MVCVCAVYGVCGAWCTCVLCMVCGVCGTCMWCVVCLCMFGVFVCAYVCVYVYSVYVITHCEGVSVPCIPTDKS